MKKLPLVSVIVPTKNSAEFLEECLNSIKIQSFKKIELIVVDNHSQDDTFNIARKYTSNVYTYGPERSAQVNYGVSKAQGEYVYKVDSDFILDPEVITECVSEAAKGFDAVVVHNSPDETVSWIAKIRKFEVDMYKYDLTHSSARFVKRDVYEKIHGFNVNITAGEDYDFQNKLNRQGYRTGFIEAEAIHRGEPKSIVKHMQKYFNYGSDFRTYKDENKHESHSQLRFTRSIYFKSWRKFAVHPVKGFMFITYNILKYISGGLGYLNSLSKLHE